MTNSESVQKYQKANMELISLRVNKELHISNRLAILVAKGKAKSKRDFLLSAILSALEKAESELPNN